MPKNTPIHLMSAADLVAQRKAAQSKPNPGHKIVLSEPKLCSMPDGKMGATRERWPQRSTPEAQCIDSDDLLRRLETSHEQAQRRIKSRFQMSKMGQAGWKKPAFGTLAYDEWARKGWISPEEVGADQIMREIRAERTGQRKTMDGARPTYASSISDRLQGVMPHGFQIRHNTPLRWGREAPIPSDQYAPNMATTAARDDRLTPNAKALLQILHARCGREGITETTKGTLANIMNRSQRTIQRYLADLSQFGYILSHTRRNGRGLYVGLVVRVTEYTKPFYEDFKRTATVMAKFLKDNWGDMDSLTGSVDYSEETTTSSKKRFHSYYYKDSLTADTS